MAAKTYVCSFIDKMSKYSYVTNVVHLTNREFLSKKVFPRMPLSHSYWLDTSRCYNQRRKNSQQLFELFGSFSDTTPEKVRFDIIEHIMKNKEYYSQSGRTHLKKVKLSIDEWLDLMKSDSVFGDELMLFALANHYQKHAVVLTTN